MKMMILMRIIAQVIDIAVCIMTFILSFIFILPFFHGIFKNDILSAILILVFIVLLNILLQYPFLRVNQTIGKAFCSLEMVSINSKRPLNVSILFQREILCKLISCYFICLPILFGKPGGHEVATETKVIRKVRR